MKSRPLLLPLIGGLLLAATGLAADAPLHIGSRRELFVDHFLIDQLNGTQLQMHTPRDEGIALKFDAPWGGGFSGYVSIVRSGDAREVWRAATAPADERDS